jgi:hypothetical protein
MKTFILSLVALFYMSCAFGAEGPDGSVPIAGQDSFVQVKLTSSMSATSSKPGDAVTAVVMGPAPALLGALLEGTIDRADHDVLAFSFHTLSVNGKTYPIQSRVVSLMNSKNIAGQDDLGQRIRIEGPLMIAYGVTTTLDEGAEIHLSIWEK